MNQSDQVANKPQRDYGNAQCEHGNVVVKH
jgi:hypothetical protein